MLHVLLNHLSLLDIVHHVHLLVLLPSSECLLSNLSILDKLPFKQEFRAVKGVSEGALSVFAVKNVPKLV